MNHLSYIRSKEIYNAEYKTIPQGLREMAQANSTKEMIVFYSPHGVRESVTFSELYNKSQQFARVLSTMGVQKGDRVIIRLYNSMEWLIIVFGLMALGAIPVSSYIIRTDISDLNRVLQMTDAVGIFFSEQDPDITSRMKRLVTGHCNKVMFIVSTDIKEDEGMLLSYQTLLKKVTPNVKLDDIYLDPDDEAFIMRSSGSTGQPKLISHSHMTLRKYCSYLVNPGQKQFSNAKFSWLGGSPIVQICIGETKVTLSGDPSLVPVDQMLQYAANESCALLELTTYSMNLLLKEKLQIPPSVKTVILGGSPIKQKFQILLESAECLLCGYATLESGDTSKIEIKKGMILEDYIAGYPSPGVELKIVDDNNVVVETETIGRIFTRTNAMFLGYVEDKEATEEAVNPSRWYNTGDIGYVSQCGKLYVIGRNGDCVTRDTTTVYVSDIQKVVEHAKIECIEDVVIVPLPNELWNEEICACIIVKSGQTITEEELLQQFDDMINEPYYKPQHVVFIDSFPVTASGKINRKLLSDIAMNIVLGREND